MWMNPLCLLLVQYVFRILRKFVGNFLLMTIMWMMHVRRVVVSCCGFSRKSSLGISSPLSPLIVLKGMETPEKCVWCLDLTAPVSGMRWGDEEGYWMSEWTFVVICFSLSSFGPSSTTSLFSIFANYFYHYHQEQQQMMMMFWLTVTSFGYMRRGGVGESEV